MTDRDRLLEIYRLMEDLADEHDPDDARLVKVHEGMTEVRLRFDVSEEQEGSA